MRVTKLGLVIRINLILLNFEIFKLEFISEYLSI